MTSASRLRRDLAWGGMLGAAMGLASLAASRPQALWLAAPVLLLALAWWALNGATRWVVAFLAAVILLPPLPLPGGDAGPHPAILLAVLGVWAGAARLPGWRIRWTFLSISLCFFFSALLASVPLALLYSGWEVAAGSLARVGLFGISVYVFFYLAYGPGRDLAPERLVRLLFWAGFASAAFACLDFYFQFPAPARFAEQYVWFSTDILRRAQGVFYEATTLGSFCVFLLVMLASIAALQSGSRLRLGKLWLAAAALVLLAGLIFSFSRSAIASLAVALAALLWVERERFRTRRKLVRRGLLALALLAGVAALIGRLFPEFLPAYFQRIWLSGEYLLSAPGVVLAPRLESWQFLWSYIAAHPWSVILGIGYKTLPYSQYLGRPVVADNMYLSLLVETGWTGFAALLLLNAAVLLTSYRQAARSRAADAASRLRRLFGLWMFCFWCGQIVQMFSGDILTYWRLLPLYFSVLALGLRLDEDSVSRSI